MTIEPGGKDLSTAGGSRDRSDAIAREVFEREPPLNVPYEFLNLGGKKMSTLQGCRRGGAHDRRGHPARAAALPVPAPAPEPGDRVRSRRHGRGPAAVRRVRQVRGGDGGPRGQGRAAAGLRGDVPLLAARSERRRRGRGGALPAGLRAPRAARPDPGRRRRGAGRGGEGESADRARARRSSTNGSPRPAPGSRPTRPNRAKLAVRRDAIPEAAADLDDSQRRFLAGLSNVGEREAPAGGDAWQSLIFLDRQERRAAAATGIRGDLPRVPRSAERTARRLAPGRPRSGVRDGTSVGSRRAGPPDGGPPA